MQRTLIRVLRLLPLHLAYGLMAFAIPFYVLFDGRGRKASYRFFHRHIGYGPLKALWHVFVNMYNMGKVVLDRFAAYGGHRFRIGRRTGPRLCGLPGTGGRGLPGPVV